MVHEQGRPEQTAQGEMFSFFPRAELKMVHELTHSSERVGQGDRGIGSENGIMY